MTDQNTPIAPAADVRQALIVDLQQFLERDDGAPPTIGDLARSDGLYSSLAQRLIDAVGGVANVENLHDQPHVHEEFEWSGIAESDQSLLSELVRLIASDSPVPRSDGEKSMFEHIGLEKMRPRLPWCGTEYQTIALRVLRTLALDPQRPLDRRIKPERLAAAIVWISLSTSGVFARGRRIKPTMLWDWFEVSSCKKLGRELADHVRRRNASVNASDEVDLRDDPYSIGETTLGGSRLLHSTFRAMLLEQRDELLERVIREHSKTRDAHPIVINGPKKRVGFRSRPVTVRWATRGENEDSGRAAISIAFGEGLDDIEMLGLSIPDARRLIEALQYALDAPIAA